MSGYEKKKKFSSFVLERLKSVFMQEPYKLKADEEWPEEVAHLFGHKREGEEEEESKSFVREVWYYQMEP